jgi:hypothetical protein
LIKVCSPFGEFDGEEGLDAGVQVEGFSSPAGPDGFGVGVVEPVHVGEPVTLGLLVRRRSGCSWSVRRSSGRSIEHYADLAAGALIGEAVGLASLLQRVAVRDDPLGMKVPAHQML